MLENLKNIDNPDYWAFKGRSKRQHCHSFFQYPAMMVPQMQGELIDAALSSNPQIVSILDPFVGSGTTMGEALFRGLNFGGIDINPLAILACKVKSKSGSTQVLQQKTSHLFQAISQSQNTVINVNFSSIDKWFLPRVQVELSRIKLAIEDEPTLWVRRFFWLALAETVRLTSNSRLSTYKLHIMKPEDTYKIHSPIQVFTEVLQNNLGEYKKQSDVLSNNKMLSKGRYTGSIDLVLGDVLKDTGKLNKKYDLMITSPPYGDNTTTVPYGQFSFLPLQWINLDDISRDKSIKRYLESAYRIDRESIGGINIDFKSRSEALMEKSSVFAKSMEKLIRLDGQKRLVSFVYDMDKSLAKILSRLNKGALMIWTLGNRRINDVEIPFDAILSELLIAQGATFLSKFERNIPSKRMARRNKVSATMSQETILVFTRS